jgi:hypothetical protein
MIKEQIYSEVYAILAALGDEYIRKTPIEFLDFISENRDKDYTVKIGENIPMKKQRLSEETIAIIAMLKLDFWCDNDDEKSELQAILEMNEQKANNQPLSMESKKAWIKLLKHKS